MAFELTDIGPTIILALTLLVLVSQAFVAVVARRIVGEAALPALSPPRDLSTRLMAVVLVSLLWLLLTGLEPAYAVAASIAAVLVLRAERLGFLLVFVALEALMFAPGPFALGLALLLVAETLVALTVARGLTSRAARA